ncbi:MAG TPA: hemolysin family protein [Candidatus Limnocylindria bacterium]|nr:hemolysin family protein [Candidatus Limnocylindria bacterium]
MDLGWALLLTLVLVLVTAFFVAAEYALVRVRETQLAELASSGNALAALGLRMVRRIDEYISATQVGITGANLGLGIVGEPAFFNLITRVFLTDAAAEGLVHALSFVLAFTIVTFLTIVIGELAPKYLALHSPRTVLLVSAAPLFAFTQLVRPFIWAVGGAARMIVRPFGAADTAREATYSEEELRLLVAASARSGVLQESERELLHNVLSFADKIVRQVMVPRTGIVAVEASVSVADVTELAQKHPYTRYPVFREDLDNVIGVVHARDLVGMSAEQTRRTRVTQVMRRVVAVPETMHLDRALAEMRRQRIPLFLVIDEFGGTAGLVTMEDILEELVGELRDEFDKGAPLIRKQDDGSYIVDGLTGLDDLRQRLHLDLEDEPYDTVGGLVFGKLGRLARIGDIVEVDGWRAEVTAMDGRRVAQVRLRATHRPGAARTQ